jgi:hypothetical protein
MLLLLPHLGTILVCVSGHLVGSCPELKEVAETSAVVPQRSRCISCFQPPISARLRRRIPVSEPMCHSLQLGCLHCIHHADVTNTWDPDILNFALWVSRAGLVDRLCRPALWHRRISVPVQD